MLPELLEDVQLAMECYWNYWRMYCTNGKGMLPERLEDIPLGARGNVWFVQYMIGHLLVLPAT
jgi:hypothetical protein